MMKVDEDRARTTSRPPRLFVRIDSIILLLVVIDLISACSRLPKTPTPGVQTIIAPLIQSSMPRIASATLTAMEAGAVPGEMATQPMLIPAEPTSATAGPTPTHTPCPRPLSWISYEILPGDTLFSLANATNTTIEAIMQANCMENDLIIAYKRIYLPRRPPAPPPAPPAPPPAAVPPTQIPPIAIPSLTLAPGGGNNGDDVNFVPCEGGFVTPEVQALSNRDTMEVGERQYFYACGFPTNAVVVTAKVILPDGSVMDASLYDNHPNRDLKKGNSSKIIEWPALPGQPIGWYSMIITDNQGNAAPPFPFLVKAPTAAHILPMPVVGSIGGRMKIYYVYFNLQSMQTFLLFGEKQSLGKIDHTLDFLQQWELPIDRDFKFDNVTYNVPADKGWAVSDLNIPNNYTPGAYAISDLNRTLNYLFWIE